MPLGVPKTYFRRRVSDGKLISFTRVNGREVRTDTLGSAATEESDA